MADNVEIQGLEFQIQENSEGAVSGINNLKKALSGLKGATGASVTGLNATSKSIRELKNALSGLNSGDVSKKLTQIATGLKALESAKNIKISSSIANQLNALNAALANVRWTDGDNADHLEYGLVTIPFPIPQDQYNDTIKMLEALDIGDPRAKDCMVEEIEGCVPSLKCLEGHRINVDELDYLVKRLDSFSDGELAQFQGMVVKMGLSDMTDLINLTFCCQQATVITDFSDLEQIGRDHYMNLHGGCASMEELERLDARKTALDLILNDTSGQITPYGVVYDNGTMLGTAYRERDKGIFCQGHYVRKSSLMIPMPETSQLLQPAVGDYAIRVRLASRENMEGVWVGFPDTGDHMDAAHPDELLLGLDELHAETLSECIVLEADCCLPQLEEIPDQYASAGELVRHAIDFGYAWAERGQGEPHWLDKWQAVLELEDCHRLDQALDYAQNLRQYAFVPRGLDLAEYGRELAVRDGVIPKSGLLAECFDCRAYAEEYMNQHGLSATDHGYVAWNGGEISYEYSQPKQSNSPSMSM